MLDREPLGDGRMKVTFSVPNVSGVSSVVVVGEFNDWSDEASPMTRTQDGFEAVVAVKSGTSYRFRYFFDGARWENAWNADGYVDNEFGGHDSLLDLTGEPLSS
jgi:1,4-alpha-glucan branching enzyme